MFCYAEPDPGVSLTKLLEVANGQVQAFRVQIVSGSGHFKFGSFRVQAILGYDPFGFGLGFGSD